MGKGITHTKVVSKLATGSGGGGGGGGDMFAAIYDPAGYATQVLVEPISITFFDFLDLKDGTNLAGNNPSLNRLVLGQTYKISNLIAWGYNSNCRLYVSTVADESGIVKPEAIGTLTYPTGVDTNKVMTLIIDWYLLGVNQVFFQDNVIQTSVGTVPIDVGLSGGSVASTISSSRFYRTQYDVSGTGNQGGGVSILDTTFNNCYIYVLDGQIVNISGSDVKNSALSFTPADGSGNLELFYTVIENSVVTYNDNTGASTNTTLEECYVSNLSLTLGKDVSLIRCRFIGPGDWLSITIPDGYTANGKTFIYGDRSDFETTIELDSTVSGGTLTLPAAYTDWVGVYRTTNTSGTSYVIDKIDVGFNAMHRFRIYGNSDKKINFTVTNSGGAAAAGNFFVPYTVVFTGVYELTDYYDYWEFQKSDIEGEPDALRVTDYSTLG